MPNLPSIVVFIEPLTSREGEVLQRLAKGDSNAQIGVTLVITEKTARSHLARIFSKLNVTTRLECVLTAQELGLVSTPGQLSPEAVACVALLRARPSVLAELAALGLLEGGST